ncbi:MAG: hypothetical protein RLO12_20715 [Fulvivirga sp.]
MEEGSFSSVRQSMMVISCIIISLYILEIDVDKSTLSMPLIGADIKNPSALFYILYAIFFYSTWKYIQYLIKKDNRDSTTNLDVNRLEEFKIVYLKKYAHLHSDDAKSAVAELYNQAYEQISINKNPRFTNFNSWEVIYVATVLVRNNLVDSMLDQKVRIKWHLHFMNFLRTEPLVTYNFLPAVFITIVLFLACFPVWDGGLGLSLMLKNFFNYLSEYVRTNL